MKPFNNFLVVAFVWAAMLLPNIVQAMEIRLFDHLAAQDRQAFLDSLSRDAETVLNQEGRSDDAQKVHHLFNYIHQGDALPIGEAELEMNLGNARVADAKRHLNDPNARRLEVEDVFFVTLKRNGVKMTPDFFRSFMQLTGTFRPNPSLYH